MSRDDLRKLIRRQPFEPFRVVTSSRQTYDVRHPEMAALGRHELHLIIADEKNPESDNWAKCSLPHIASVEALPAA